MKALRRLARRYVRIRPARRISGALYLACGDACPGKVELRGPPLVRPPPPSRCLPPPTTPPNFEPWPASRGWTVREGLGRRERGPDFADKRRLAPPG